MKNVYAYYNMKGRLIRVKEDTLSHFKDITPYSQHKVAESVLKASYIAWRDAGDDSGKWELIGSYDFFADADEIKDIMDNFKGVADYRKPQRAGSRVSPDMIENMRARYESGESMYSIAQKLNVDRSTVRYHVKERAA